MKSKDMKSKDKSAQYAYDGCRIFVADPELEYEWQENISFQQKISCSAQTPPDLIDLPAGWVFVAFLENERVLCERLFKDGQLHGPQRRFSLQADQSKASLLTEIWYRNGVRHGRFFSWYPNTAQKIFDISFKEGLRHGKSRYWTESGCIKSDMNFYKGQFHGVFKTYHPTLGTEVRLQEWKEGLRHGVDLLYHGDDGFLLFVEEWADGAKTRLIFEDVLEKSLHGALGQPNKRKDRAARSSVQQKGVGSSR